MNNVELSKIQLSRHSLRYEKLLFIFGISFCVCQVPFLGSEAVLCLPVLGVAFACGYLDVLMYFLGVGLAVIILDVSWELLALSLATLGVLVVLSFVYAMKTHFLGYVVTFCLGAYLLLKGYLGGRWMPAGTLVQLLTALGLSLLYIDALPLLRHRQIEDPSDRMLMGGFLMVMSALFCLERIDMHLLMVMLRFGILVVMYVKSIEMGYQLVIYASYWLLLNESGLMGEVESLFICLAVFFLVKAKSRLAFVLTFLFSHLVMPFFVQEGLWVIAVEVMLTGFLFMLIPQKIYASWRYRLNGDSPLATQIGGLISYQRKMSRQLETFSDLFLRIATSFEEENLETNAALYVGNMYEQVCSTCLNCDQCYNRETGDHRLVKLIRKGVIQGLTNQETRYVERYCLKMAEYKKALREQHKLYLHQAEMNEEYHQLKHHLYGQLSLVGKLLERFSKHVDCSDLESEENIRDLLEGYHYLVPYIHKDYLSRDDYCLDIGMMEVNKHEVYDVVIPVLERYLNTPLNVIKMETSGRQLGYMRLVLSNHQNYQLVYGVQQLSKDAASCGDSYLCFHFKQFTLMALSDGMGYGPKAHKESELTLDVFSRLLKSGIGLEESIQTINSLLKIKNRIEMFTTLDLLMFNTRDASVTFLKNGATASYVYHYNQLDKVQTRALPIGIVSKVDTHTEKYQCSDGDLLFMFSDGLEEGIEEVIEQCLREVGDRHPQLIADTIMNTFIDQGKVDDDATIIVVRVEDITQIHTD